jgi:hypothetical protein
MSRYALNFWSCTYSVAASGEGELKARAQSVADERRVRVGYFEVIDGRSTLLGVATPAARAGAAISLVE